MAAWIRVLIGTALALSMSPAGCSKEDSNVPEKSAEHAHGQIVQVMGIQEFETHVLQADKPVLVDFSATWCPPCKLLAPIIDRLANEYTGRVEFVMVDGDQSPELISEYRIGGYPTVVIFSGGKAGERLVGLHKAGEYRAALDTAITNANGKGQQ